MKKQLKEFLALMTAQVNKIIDGAGIQVPMFERWYFSIQEFIIDISLPGPFDVQDKIFRNFIYPLNFIRINLNLPIIVSKKSGFRHPEYEKRKGRSETGVHTFVGMGAADLTCSDMPALLHELKTNSPFTRICYYPNMNFVHVDYEFPDRGKRYFEDNSDGKGWIFKEKLAD